MRINLFFLIVLIFWACQKETDVIRHPEIVGQWRRTAVNFQQSKYEQASRFDAYDFGLIFFGNGRFTEKSESGICIGEKCLTQDYYGHYTWTGEAELVLKITNYHGYSEKKYDIVIDKDSVLTLIFKN